MPADVDMADRIFAGLTARQLRDPRRTRTSCSRYAALGERLPLALSVRGVPVCLLGLLWATTSLEGATWEQLARSQALRQASTPGARS